MEKLKNRFNNIYPFTTENIAGYMNGLNLQEKRIITVTGSSDQIINAILNGAIDITTFDINPLTKYYMDLKLAGLKRLSYEDFLKVFLYNTSHSFNYKIISRLPMPEESKKFWLEQLALYQNDGQALKRSDLFHISYFNPESIMRMNMYLNKRNYKIVKKRLNHVKITYFPCSLQDLQLSRDYDYMFLSNIFDYLNLMYEKDALLQYKELLERFLEHVKQIYFAYLYDIGTLPPQGEMQDIKQIRQIFGNTSIETFRSVYNDGSNKRDGVLILRKK